MSEKDQKENDADVLVLGAGMAGLAAARALAIDGQRVLVLEAEDRVGGRIFTRHVGDEIVELGAEFIHGQPPQLLALIKEAGLELVERDGSTVRFQHGELRSDEQDDDDSGQPKSPFVVLEELEDHSGPDLSFAEFLATKHLSEEACAAAIGFVEGFNAADHHVISIAALGFQQKAEDAIEGDRAFHITGGYDQLPRFLAAKVQEFGGQILPNTRVRRLEWSEGRVLAIAGKGEDQRSFSARRIVIALPLGVLQRGEPEFRPALPASIRDLLAIDGPIRMGHAARFTLVFKERFWRELPPQPALAELSFLFTPAKIPPVWWTPHPEASNTITGWVGGPRSSALAGLSVEAVGEQACAVLAEAFQLDAVSIRDQLSGCYLHDWSADISAAGAYSYIAKRGIDAPEKFVEPIADTIYFAGEHTTTDGHWGTVHAALSSGLRAAAQILAGREALATS
ncbi:monoamine oxidase [Granulicella aggregans]|uniref:Tryptophan 2-monooxygenase n=1 Tax=Granulicella aggregans TaxID=474949 RepID=A0A7W8E437_9BACT|nr:NAD(P)/FAD-dependent oxidoreductase [Granulicella aggregans]MBB5056765.1 monoamine oxidase [Granulicella aggregans]